MGYLKARIVTVPTRFQVLGWMVDRMVHTHHNYQKYVCYSHQDGYL